MFFDASPVRKTIPTIPESSVLNIPLMRTDSLLSLDSLANSYSDNDDDEDLNEHVTFLRIQTEPRSFVAWDEG